MTFLGDLVNLAFVGCLFAAPCLRNIFGSLLVLEVVQATSGWGVATEVTVNLIGQVLIVIDLGSLLGILSSCLSLSPVCLDVADLSLQVSVGVVVLADAADTLPQRQVLRVDSDTVVISIVALEDVGPTAFLLLQIETGGVGEPEPGDEHTSETEPRYDVELGRVVNVVVKYGSKQSSGFSDTRRESVGTGADLSREDFTGDEESHGVGAELVEERRQEVHGLECVDTGRAGVVLVVKSRNDEEEEAHEEANLLHHLSSVHLVVDQ